MSVLGAIKLKKLTLPSSTSDDPNFVELNLSVTAHEFAQVSGGSDEETSNGIIAKCIKSWSFTDAEGKPAPITAENVGLLPGIDLAAINKALGFAQDTTEAKKNS